MLLYQLHHDLAKLILTYSYGKPTRIGFIGPKTATTQATVRSKAMTVWLERLGSLQILARTSGNTSLPAYTCEEIWKSVGS